jgi:predicted house-cleaning noncanonical NTP pyrophosphatase (MazG superfamily)
MDMVRRICAGVGDRFRGVVCKFYVRLTVECDLLKKEKLDSIFKNGRCDPYRFLESAVKKNLERYKDVINVWEHVSSIAFLLSKRLQDIRLKKGHNLAVLIGYIKKSAYTEVILFLQNEGLLEKKICGNCIFLSELKPYVCRKENIEVMENEVGELKPNPFYLKQRNKTDKCQDGFRPHASLSINRDSDHNYEDNFQSEVSEKLTDLSVVENLGDRLEIEKIGEVLKKRAKDTKHTNTKKIYKRQHNVFVNLYHYISEGYSVRKAIELIAIKIGKNAKTIERDIIDIRSFLTKELVYN